MGHHYYTQYARVVIFSLLICKNENNFTSEIFFIVDFFEKSYTRDNVYVIVINRFVAVSIKQFMNGEMYQIFGDTVLLVRLLM